MSTSTKVVNSLALMAILVVVLTILGAGNVSAAIAFGLCGPIALAILNFVFAMGTAMGSYINGGYGVLLFAATGAMTGDSIGSLMAQ